MKSAILLPFNKNGQILVKDLSNKNSKYIWEFLKDDISSHDINSLSTCNRIFNVNCITPENIKEGEIVFKFNVDARKMHEIRTVGCIVNSNNCLPGNKWVYVYQLRNLPSIDKDLIPQAEKLFLSLENQMHTGINTLFSLRGSYGYIPSDRYSHR